MSRSTCESCKALNILNMTCRKRAPTAIPIGVDTRGQPMIVTFFPVVAKSDWCLEHEPDLMSGGPIPIRPTVVT